MKASDAWREVVKAIMGLWPEHHKRHWSPYVEKAWRQRLGHLPLDSVLASLQHHATDRPYFPKAGEIAKTISVKRESSVGDRKEKTVEEEKKEFAIYLETAKEFYATIPEDEKLAHKLTTVKQDWRYEHAAGFKLSHPLWRSVINHRVRRGLAPDQPDPDIVVPPRPVRQGVVIGNPFVPEPEPVTLDSDGYPEI